MALPLLKRQTDGRRNEDIRRSPESPSIPRQGSPHHPNLPAAHHHLEQQYLIFGLPPEEKKMTACCMQVSIGLSSFSSLMNASADQY